MSDAAREMELSEFERLEFGRRKDVTYAVIPHAARLFHERALLDERIENESKAAHSYWYWIIGGGGLALQFFLSSMVFEFTWGTGSLITLGAVASWWLRQYELVKLRVLRDKCTGRLYELEMIWNSATGEGTFWSISDFASDFYPSTKDSKFHEWWLEQELSILQRVCGWERGYKIGEEWVKRFAAYPAK